MRHAHAFALLLSCLAVVLAGNRHYYAPDLTHKRLARHIRDQPRTLKKRATNGFGLKDDSVTLYKNGVALGWLPNFETRGSVAAVNAPLDEPMSLIGDFVQIYANEDQKARPLEQIDFHIANVTATNGAQQPVYVIALMPQDGFAAVTPAVITTVVDKMAALNAQGITVWLRYAHEMNLGASFCSYCGTADAFKASFRALAQAIKADPRTATNTFMLWSPNVDREPTPNYATYYPGDDVTDLLGLSLYSFAANARTRNDALTGTEFSSTFESFYDLYSYRGPRLVISETGKPYNYVENEFPWSPQSGSAQGQEITTKRAWLEQLLSPASRAAFPNLISVNSFEFIKNEVGVTADFRTLTGIPSVRNAVAG